MSEPTILVQFGDNLDMIALCREDANEDLNDLCWCTATAERVAADIETPPAAVGTLVDPILVSGIDDERITVLDAIDRLAELYMTTEAPLGPLRDTESVTEEDCREWASEVILRESIDALDTFGPDTMRVGGLAGFCSEIAAAAAVCRRCGKKPDASRGAGWLA